MQNKNPDITKNTGSLIVKYPEAVEFTNQQLKIFWLPEEIHVDKDVQDILVNMTESEKHGVITTLKLFTMYELKAGAEFWSGKFKRMFKRCEFQRMGATFSMFELAVHQPFYQKINELLHIHTDEFYNSYADDETLKSRMEFIDNIVGSKNDLLSLAGFSMVEGAVLYSSFAFLKHFQSQGKNKLLNVVRGINFSVRDECLAEGTEVLTTDGWKRIEDVTTDDCVMQYDICTSNVGFVQPSRITKTLSTESYIFSGENYHQHVTPNHRMVTSSGVVFAKDSAEDVEYIISGEKTSGDDVLSEEDIICLEMVNQGDLSTEWIYNKIEHASSAWAEEAVKYYLKL